MPRDHVLARLVDQIRKKKLGVGDRLPSIRQLATDLNSTPSAIRDGLMQAQTMGLVDVRPRSGAFVQSFSFAPLVDALASTLEPALLQVDENLFHLLEARRLLETELIAQAARRRRLEDLLPVRQCLAGMLDSTPQAIRRPALRPAVVDHDVQFHLRIARMAGNPVLETILRALLGLLRPHLIRLPWNEQRRKRTDRSHQTIYQALVDGNPDRARAAMADHLTMAYDSLLTEVRAGIS